jgi:hypothetical protein
LETKQFSNIGNEAVFQYWKRSSFPILENTTLFKKLPVLEPVGADLSRQMEQHPSVTHAKA